MGEVYRAKDPELDRDVAIKVLSERLSQDSEAIQHFKREAKTLAALSHPQFCPSSPSVRKATSTTRSRSFWRARRSTSG